MAYRLSTLTPLRWQKLDLNCGIYCLEAMMMWRHNCRFGVELLGSPSQRLKDGAFQVDYGGARSQHVDELAQHWSSLGKIGFSPLRVMNDYGLFEVGERYDQNKKHISWKKTPPDAAWYEKQLRLYGPMLAGGRLGLVNLYPDKNAGHFVVVVGVSSGGKIEYQDPLDIRNGFGQHPVASVSLDYFNKTVYDQQRTKADLLACMIPRRRARASAIAITGDEI